jgi:pseudo-rSAM protein
MIKSIKKNNVVWHFHITNEKEYELAEALIEKYGLENTEIKPVYVGGNLQFFLDNIYLTEEDLQSPKLSKREVFAHQALNTNDFGKLTVTAEGKVYANTSFHPIGTINDDIRKLVYEELTEGQSWLRIRDMKPCSECVYQWLCPSPSDYELAIGKPNLCHVEP